jgi:hypothetical protein
MWASDGLAVVVVGLPNTSADLTCRFQRCPDGYLLIAEVTVGPGKRGDYLEWWTRLF